MLDSILHLKLKEECYNLHHNKLWMLIQHFIILMKVEFKSNSEEIKFLIFQFQLIKLLNTLPNNQIVQLLQDFLMPTCPNMKEKIKQFKVQTSLIVTGMKFSQQLNKFTLTLIMSTFSWKMLTCMNFNMTKIQDHTNTVMLQQVSAEEDCGVSDISSIKLEVSLKKLEVILFILWKKMDQRFLSMEPLLPLQESILLPKDQVEFQMLLRCLRVETSLQLPN